MKILNELEIRSQGLSSLRVRNDCKIVAAGCWDGKYASLFLAIIEQLFPCNYLAIVVFCR